MSHIETANKLLTWNTENLNASAKWQAEDLAMFFAPEFIVSANGRRYDANYHNYTDFLNTMRENLKSIQYECHEFIVSEKCVVIPLTATLTDNQSHVEKFEAILILKFDASRKIIVWQEVYVKQEA